MSWVDIRNVSSQNIYALCDVDRKVLGRRAAEFEKAFGRPAAQFSDYRQLLADGEVAMTSAYNGRLYDAQTLDEKVTGDRKTQPFYWQ